MKTIKILIPFILIFLSTLFLVQCTEKIDIKLDNTTPLLVVDGMMTNEALVHTVRLRTTTNFYDPQFAPAVSGAIVSINDGTSTILLTEIPEKSGYYRTPADYIGVPGKKYTLTIKLITAINGQTDYTAAEVMPNAYHPDSIKMVYHNDMDIGYWETKLYIQDPPEVNFYSFRGYRNGEIVTSQLSAVDINDDKFFNGKYVYGLSTVTWLQKFENQKYVVTDVVKLQVGSITKGYYSFLSDIQIEVVPKNPLFSGPSANVRTNISNGGYGYFSVCAMSYVSTVGVAKL